MSIRENVTQLLAELPEGVQLVVAAKGKTPEEILEAVGAGARIIGENYLQEAERAFEVVGARVEWHLIGHLQRNKVGRAVKLFDMIETVDSSSLAREIDKRCAQIGKTMPVLIEVNSGREPQKSGVLPEGVESLVREISALPNIRVEGLMTMGPDVGDPEDARPYFTETKKVFDHLKGLGLPGIFIKHLSMGMTNSYRVAIEEGANIVRIGSKIFGESPG
ncbi:MAG: YggS family pyridoxal phosphate-dependent enzyme [Dehalococcoidales bacterium]|nr:MAG: YggS family pyridoxal phosphate-dependent enzyme [Dehalococcoidales bacterium]